MASRLVRFARPMLNSSWKQTAVVSQRNLNFSPRKQSDDGQGTTLSVYGASTNTFHGISQQPFPKDAADILMAKIDDADIEIKPDGHIYLPEIKYRRILNRAFGPGGWAMMPRGNASYYQADGDNAQLMVREYALFVLGRFVSQAVGEHMIYHRGQLSYGKAFESTRSNALMRCCKDLGIASELWDPQFTAKWKKEHAETVYPTGSKKALWRKKVSK